jgi:hypothetical protein
VAHQPSPTYTWAVTVDVTGLDVRLHFERFDSDGTEAYCVAVHLPQASLPRLESLLTEVLEVGITEDLASQIEPF